MTKSEINKEIAKLLGFEVKSIDVNKGEDTYFYWSYPVKYQSHIACMPTYYVPDFVNIIDQGIKFGQSIMSGQCCKVDFDTVPTEKDIECKNTK